jgi:hypothetical protein
MEKLPPLFALQTDLLGLPSINLHDLFAQGGSEWTKNVFVQNRNPVRVDKLLGKNPDADFQKYLDEAARIFKGRSHPECQVLHDGSLLPVTPDEHSGILPIVRDNGHQQVITLVNVGNPKSLSWEHKAGEGPTYETVDRQKSQDKSFKIDLSELALRDGTMYQDVDSMERFQLRNNVLHPVDLDGKADLQAGVPVRSWRRLVREARVKS